MHFPFEKKSYLIDFASLLLTDLIHFVSKSNKKLSELAILPLFFLQNIFYTEGATL